MSTANTQPSHSVTVTVPATSANLGPGFDCLGMSLDLRNEIRFDSFGEQTFDGDGATLYSIRVSGIDAGKVPLDQTNLAVEAAELIFEHIGRRPGKVDIAIDNCIPVGSGLGSSSSAIVGGLVAANALMDGGLSTTELLAMAVAIEGHPDNVAPALLGGLVLGVLPHGDLGPEHLITQRWDPPPWTAVIVLPEFKLLTSEARSVIPATISRDDAIFNISRFGLLIHALATGEQELLRVAMSDRLHQPYRLKLIPGGLEAFYAAYNAGAFGVALSGAGPSIIALTDGDGQAIADSMSRIFAQAGLGSRSWILKPSREGTIILSAI